MAYALWGKNLLGSCHMVTSTGKTDLEATKWRVKNDAMSAGVKLEQPWRKVRGGGGVTVS